MPLKYDSRINMRLRDRAYQAISESEEDEMITREVLSLMTEQRHNKSGLGQTNRYLPNVHKLALLLNRDNRFVKRQCPKNHKSVWSLVNDED
mgnify:CR=1 FL=1